MFFQKNFFFQTSFATNEQPQRMKSEQCLDFSITLLDVPVMKSSTLLNIRTVETFDKVQHNEGHFFLKKIMKLPSIYDSMQFWYARFLYNTDMFQTDLKTQR